MGIRQLLRKRLDSLDSNDCEVMANSKEDFIRSMNA
jgi:hypothetical protein